MQILLSLSLALLSPITAATSYQLCILFSSPFSFPVTHTPSFLSIILSLCIRSTQCKKMAQCFRHPLVTDRNIWLEGRHAGRKTAGKVWPLEFSADILPLDFLLIHFFNVSLPGLPIADIRELNWKKLSVSLLHPFLIQSYSVLSICLKSPGFSSISFPAALFSASFHSFVSPSLRPSTRSLLYLLSLVLFVIMAISVYCKHSAGSYLSSKMLSSSCMKGMQGLSVIWLAHMENCLWIFITRENREIMQLCQQLFQLVGPEEDKRR